MLAARHSQRAAAFGAGCRAAPRIAPVAAAPRLVVCQAAAVEAEPSKAEAVDGVKEGVCHLRQQRGSVFKIRRVLDVIRGRSYEEALSMMELMPYRACESIATALKSAAANAKHLKNASKAKLVVSECYADGGPVMKRFRPRAQGRGFKILKPTFHMTIKVEERAEA